MRAARRLVSVWESRGIVGLLRFLLGRIFTRRGDLIFDAETVRYPNEPTWEGDGRIVWIRRDNVAQALSPALRQQIGTGEGAEYLAGLEGRDMLFAVVDRGGRCLHHSFVLFDTRTKALLGESADTPLFAHCVTVPEARGRGLYPKTLRYALGVLNRCGHPRAVINCAADNAASIRGIEAAGFRLARRTTTRVLMTRIGLQTGHDASGRQFRRLFLA